MMTPNERRWWSYLRFSLRGLLVLVLIVGGSLGWLTRSAQIQRDAVSSIRRAGGLVTYDWQQKHGKLNQTTTTWAPKWLVDGIGIDYFDHVVYVSLRGRVSDAELVHVSRLTRLDYLSLIHTEVRDSQLVHIKEMTRLKELSISETKVGDAGLVHLKGLTGLHGLYLDHTMVTDAGLTHLEWLANLECASFLGTSVTNGGAKRLHNALPSLPNEF